MRIAKPDIELRAEFIRSEFKKRPKATIQEVLDSVKKKFGMGTDRRKIAKIRSQMASKKAGRLPEMESSEGLDVNIDDIIKKLSKAMVLSPYLTITFSRNANKVSVRWKKVVVLQKFEEGGL